VGAGETQYLGYLVQIQWVQVLNDCGYVPPPRIDQVACEVACDVRALVDNRDNAAALDDSVDQLRSYLQAVVDGLNRQLATPQKDRDSRWWRRLRHRAGVGLEVLRHVNLASLSFAAAETAVVAVVPAVMVPIVLPVLAATVVVSVAAAASAQLREANRRLSEEEAGSQRDAVIATMDGILDGLNKSIEHCTTANKQMTIRGQGRPGGPTTPPVPGLPRNEVIKGFIVNFRDLETQIATLLPSAWVYCCAEMGYEGRQRIEDSSDFNAELHVAITALEMARTSPGGDIESSLAKVETAAKTLADSVKSLRELCVARGVCSRAA